MVFDFLVGRRTTTNSLVFGGTGDTFSNTIYLTGPQHAGHLAPGTCLVPDEAKHRHRSDDVEALRCERKFLDLAFDEIEMQPRGIRARTRRDQHLRVRIETDHMGAGAHQVHGECPIAATDVENVEARNVADHRHQCRRLALIRDATQR